MPMLASLLFAIATQSSVISQAQMEIDGHRLTIYEVSGLTLKSAVTSSGSTNPALRGKKDTAGWARSDAHFKIDGNGLKEIRDWIDHYLANTDIRKSGVIEFGERQVSFGDAYLTQIEFPNGQANDSGLIDVSFSSPTVRITPISQNSGSRTSPAKPPSRITRCTIEIEGLKDPSVQTLVARPGKLSAMSADAVGDRSVVAKEPAASTISDLQFSQPASKFEAISSWARDWYVLGKHQDEHERTTRITYFSKASPAFALVAGHTGFKAVNDAFAGENVDFSLYAESLAIDAPKANAAPPKDVVESPSQDGKFGTEYSTDDGALSITVLKAEYKGERFAFGTPPNTGEFVPSATQKILVTTMRVKNIGTAPVSLGYAAILVNAVDGKDVQTQADLTLVRASDQIIYSSQIDPGVSVDLQCSMLLAGSEPGRKLVISGSKEGFATTYDLTKNKVSPLPPSLADPANSLGSTLLDEVAAKAGTSYPTGAFDIVFNSVTATRDLVDGAALADTDENALVSLKVSNGCRGEKTFAFGALKLNIFDSEGHLFESISPLTKNLKWATLVLGPVGSDTASADVKFAFLVPKGTKFTKLRIQEGIGHPYVFALK